MITLTILEIVLGIDNVIFIAILAGKVEPEKRDKARQLGLGLALVMRVILLCFASFIAQLKYPAFTVPFEAWFGWAGATNWGPSWRDIILLTGGLFLLFKATKEIHHSLEGTEHGHSEDHTAGAAPVYAAFSAVVWQIIVIDLVFSIDSVITAVGMTNNVSVMIAAVVISMGFMLAFSGWVSDFVNRHPTVKMLALAFLMLIGFTLVVEGCGAHISKNYIYFAMAFSVAVEVLNIIAKGKKKKQQEPVHLRPTMDLD
ncbi:hypothetical protein DB346_08810 [Verrucomicrobia bacterium LW23]|nr:hypothetical protein DB346_08810 [Verrucomicrobia bacterium LW23]